MRSVESGGDMRDVCRDASTRGTTDGTELEGGRRPGGRCRPLRCP